MKIIPLLLTCLMLAASPARADYKLHLKHERTIDVRAHIVDGLAKLICESERKDCWTDWRCTPGTGTCNAVKIIGDPWVWTTYRERAETMLKEMFQ